MMFMPTDAAAAGLRDLSDTLRRKGATVLCTGCAIDGPISVPVVQGDHPDTDAVCLVQSFYKFLGELAAACGTDLEKPRHLQKVTRTR
jgi:glucosamine--fructose-6-phosphate aminotransferase (isomerizing)